MSSAPDIRIVIIGGSFAGLTAARRLCHFANSSSTQLNISVVVIDPRDYFEYTPAVLRAIVKPDVFADVILPLSQIQPPVHHHQSYVSAVTDSAVRCSDGSTLRYDYLIIACGSAYDADIKPNDTTLTLRQNTIRRCHSQLKRAAAVTIIGGGLVGVEFAAEIAECIPQTKLTIRIRDERVLKGFPPAARQYATNFLTKRHVTITTHSTVSAAEYAGTASADEVVYDCTGLKAVVLPDLTDSALRSAHVDRAGSLRVNTRLQVCDSECAVLAENVFAIGDIASDPSRNIKMAYTAELQAEVCAMNVISLITRSSMHEYPIVLSGVTPPPTVIACSLGAYDGIVLFNTIAAYGYVAAAMKAFIQRSKIWQYRGWIIGTLTWRIGESATMTLNRIGHLFRRTTNDHVI